MLLLRGLHQAGHIMQRRVITSVIECPGPGPGKLVTSNVSHCRHQALCRGEVAIPGGMFWWILREASSRWSGLPAIMMQSLFLLRFAQFWLVTCNTQVQPSLAQPVWIVTKLASQKDSDDRKGGLRIISNLAKLIIICITLAKWIMMLATLSARMKQLASLIRKSFTRRIILPRWRLHPRSHSRRECSELLCKENYKPELADRVRMPAAGLGNTKGCKIVQRGQN